MDIKINRTGKITGGDDNGRYVRVIDDAVNTGGYLILVATEPDMAKGFDDWVESKEALSRFFEEAGWTIEWL